MKVRFLKLFVYCLLEKSGNRGKMDIIPEQDYERECKLTIGC